MIQRCSEKSRDRRKVLSTKAGIKARERRHQRRRNKEDAKLNCETFHLSPNNLGIQADCWIICGRDG
ncbi:hypothetical protein TNCV_85961 [Trichonephila clavipes]|nr:hypothetical protein TNCV_3089341 [Trichonephila clavipes]GFW62595.1 hypothetical protein TNCV_85961 [Trichonephila clavipes]